MSDTYIRATVSVLYRCDLAHRSEVVDLCDADFPVD